MVFYTLVVCVCKYSLKDFAHKIVIKMADYLKESNMEYCIVFVYFFVVFHISRIVITLLINVD